MSTRASVPRLFSMWTDAIRHFAENGKGNVIFLDGSSDNMRRTLEEMMALSSGIRPTGAAANS
jgi:hypothetical protein